MKAQAIIEGNDEKRRGKIRSLLRTYGKKGQVLILVPEVHMLDVYREIGTVFYAGLKQSEKKKIRQAVALGGENVIVGTQKALFLPYKKLAAVIIDEEQYESYKLWDQYPRLYTVRGAQVVSAIHNAALIYASSYPSIFLRHAIAAGHVKTLIHNPILLSPSLISFSFEDRKYRRVVPDEASRHIRAWARRGIHVLALYNKKDNARVRDAITARLPKQAIKRIHIGTTALLAHTPTNIDRVVWLFPEFTMRAYDYRASERARMLAARLQAITPKSPVLIATRYADMAKNIFSASEEEFTKTVLEERSRLQLPPYTDLVRLTSKRALHVRTMLDGRLPADAKVFGPFQEYKATGKATGEYHLLVQGSLDALADIYRDVPVDTADVDPHTIV